MISVLLFSLPLSLAFRFFLDLLSGSKDAKKKLYVKYGVHVIRSNRILLTQFIALGIVPTYNQFGL